MRRFRQFMSFILAGLSAFSIYAQVDMPIVSGDVTVSGTVRGSYFGGAISPIENASVTLQLMAISTGAVPAPAFIDSTVTDGNGEYVLENVYSNMMYQMTFSADGFQTKSFLATMTKDTTINVTLIAVSQFYTLTGRVARDCPMCGGLLSPPVEGCSVTVILPSMIYTADQPVASDRMIPVVQLSYTGVTGADGIYRIDSIPALNTPVDSSWVVANKTGFTSQTVRKALNVGRIDTVDFMLDLLTSTVVPSSVQKSSSAVMTLSRGANMLNIDIGNNQKFGIKVFNVDGRVICTILPEKFLAAGHYSIPLDVSRLGKGIAVIRGRGDGINCALKVYRF